MTTEVKVKLDKKQLDEAVKKEITRLEQQVRYYKNKNERLERQLRKSKALVTSARCLIDAVKSETDQFDAEDLWRD